MGAAPSISVRITLFDRDADDVYRSLVRFFTKHAQCRIVSRDSKIRALSAEYTTRPGGCTDDVYLLVEIDEYGSAVISLGSVSKDTCGLRSVFCCSWVWCVGDCSSNQRHMTEMLEGLGVQDQDCIVELQEISGFAKWSGPRPPSKASFIDNYLPCLRGTFNNVVGEKEDGNDTRRALAYSDN